LRLTGGGCRRSGLRFEVAPIAIRRRIAAGEADDGAALALAGHDDMAEAVDAVAGAGVEAQLYRVVDALAGGQELRVIPVAAPALDPHALAPVRLPAGHGRTLVGKRDEHLLARQRHTVGFDRFGGPAGLQACSALATAATAANESIARFIIPPGLLP